MASLLKTSGAERGESFAGRLAPYAQDPATSLGRLIDEPPSPARSPYARDRDRILHATAFRRLTHKTQVFIYHEGDHYRTRLTHSLEVSQIARSMARRLRLDEDLTEALALAHDLGHPPFGHAGERALARAMAKLGGFDHNAQSLRVVTLLERKYADFDGLNLTWESLEGLLKHNGPLADDVEINSALPDSIAAYCATHGISLTSYASVEAQVAALADDIAYNNHDIEDGFRAGFFSFEALACVPLASRIMDDVQALYGMLPAPRLLHETNRRLITAMIEDVVAETERRLAKHEPRDADAVRGAGAPMVAFSPAMLGELEYLREFLSVCVYRHPRIDRIMQDAAGVVADLFALYRSDPGALPPEWREHAETADRATNARQICDFIAGMTDRYALAEHRRLFDVTPDLR